MKQGRISLLSLLGHEGDSLWELGVNDFCPHLTTINLVCIKICGAAFAFGYVDAAPTNFQSRNERSSPGNVSCKTADGDRA
ncbi:MAG TPA: hypothetical protein VEO92_05210, partial [Candidatus Nitrosocosmicus sp.]|nr:hypothetical protein [Candidatus Nitrosocosmicus sp.]